MVGAFALAALISSDYRPEKPEMQSLLFTIPFGILGILAMLLQCECCGMGLFDFEHEKPKDGFKRILSFKTYFLPKRCPDCGCEKY